MLALLPFNFSVSRVPQLREVFNFPQMASLQNKVKVPLPNGLTHDGTILTVGVFLEMMLAGVYPFSNCSFLCTLNCRIDCTLSPVEIAVLLKWSCSVEHELK